MPPPVPGMETVAGAAGPARTATPWVAVGHAGTVIHSPDGGATWQPAGDGLPGLFCDGLSARRVPRRFARNPAKMRSRTTPLFLPAGSRRAV